MAELIGSALADQRPPAQIREAVAVDVGEPEDQEVAVFSSTVQSRSRPGSQPHTRASWVSGSRSRHLLCTPRTSLWAP